MNELINKLAIEGGVEIKDVADSNTLEADVKTILTTVIGVLGFVCVIVIVIGGIGYMTSSGDTGKVKKAKDTILYGVIGLVICVLAFALVQFVIGTILAD